MKETLRTTQRTLILLLQAMLFRLDTEVLADLTTDLNSYSLKRKKALVVRLGLFK